MANRLKKVALQVVLWLMVGFFVFPLVWLLLTFFKTRAEAFSIPPKIFFTPTFEITLKYLMTGPFYLTT